MPNRGLLLLIVMPDELYRGREQTLVKHTLLRTYLGGFGHAIGLTYGAVTYVDCFSGPWRARSQKYEDTSFAIAIDELRKARDTVRRMGKDLRIRCLFIEKNPQAYSQLRGFAEKKEEPGLQIRPLEGRFEDKVGEIVSFVHEQPNSFPFIFIDPKGWKAVGVNTIAPLLALNPSEVLINLMTAHLHRFIKRNNERDLFGGDEYVARIRDLRGLDLHDEIVRLYSEAVKRRGNYRYVCAALILRPEIDTPNYRLVYATRNPLGLEKFKEAERRAMKDMQAVRPEAKKRSREERTLQPYLPGAYIEDPHFYRNLQHRYLADSRSKVSEALNARRTVAYDDLWAIALSNPLVFEANFKTWISDWGDTVRMIGLGPRERVPKRGQNHQIALIGTDSMVK